MIVPFVSTLNMLNIDLFPISHFPCIGLGNRQLTLPRTAFASLHLHPSETNIANRDSLGMSLPSEREHVGRNRLELGTIKNMVRRRLPKYCLMHYFDYFRTIAFRKSFPDFLCPLLCHLFSDRSACHLAFCCPNNSSQLIWPFIELLEKV